MEKPTAFTATELLMSARDSPQERLAVSRKALVRHMSRHARGDDGDSRDLAGDQKQNEMTEPDTGRSHSRSGFSSDTLRLLKRALSTWWRHHPANFALSVAQPLLGRYASQSPFRLLAISAGVGAALVIVKPWRLMSMGGIALATLKSSQFSGLLMSMLSSRPEDSDEFVANDTGT